MSPPDLPPSLFQRLVRETDESAALGVFTDLCRASPTLRLWLFEEFARDSQVRTKFARLLKSAERPVSRFADLDGSGRAWREERRALRARFGGRTYGGRSFDDIKELVVRHQAGRGNAAAFVLALDWRRRRPKAPLPPRLMRAACAFLTAAFVPGGAELLRDLARAAELTESFSNRDRLRAALGFTDWWKLNVLLYFMRHPAPVYRIRDLQRHLATQGLKVSPRALRQFCTENGIARDMRAGRPSPAPGTAEKPQRRPGRTRKTTGGRR